MSSVHTMARQEDRGDESDSGEVHCSRQGQSEKKVGASNKICRSAPNSSRISDGQPESIRPS